MAVGKRKGNKIEDYWNNHNERTVSINTSIKCGEIKTLKRQNQEDLAIAIT